MENENRIIELLAGPLIKMVGEQKERTKDLVVLNRNLTNLTCKLQKTRELFLNWQIKLSR
jgi:hypothetical protein